MAFLGFGRRGHGRDHERERSERDWGGERKTLDWGERRYSGGERDIGDYYGPERYGAGPDRFASNRYERPEEFGQNRGDWRDWRTSGQQGGERESGRQNWNDRWQESYGSRAGTSGRGQSGHGGSSGYGSSGERFSESAREPTHGAYWSPERSSFSDFGRGSESSSYGRGGSFGRGGEMSTYGAGQHRGRGPKGYRRSDERVREDVCECLTEDEHIDASNIEVQVKDCEVTLTGTVNSREEKRHAEDLIDGLPGVRDVTNNLRVVNESGQIEGTQSRQSGSMGQTGSTEQGSRH